jgi:hypothetical protein
MAALEAKTPLYNTSTETLFIAPPETDPGIKEVVRSLRESLAMTSFGDEEEDEDEG